MSTIINATTTNGVVIQPDNSGSLQLATNSGTTALTIDTSQRAAFVAGTAALPAITTTGDTNTGIFFPAADTIAFAEGGAEAMRLDSSGNVGIGVTPSAWISSQKGVQSNNAFWSTNSTTSNFGQNAFLSASSGNWTYTTSAAASLYEQFGGNHTWYTAASGTAGNTVTFTDRMRIDSSGSVLVNATAQLAGEKFNVSAGGSTINTAYFNFTTTDDRGNVILKHARATGATTGQQIAFLNSSGTNVGAVNSTTSATSYATSSDYRLKENVQPMVGALDKVAQLKPVTYTWKIDGSDGQGFIAHELQAVVPDAVVGEKDAVDEDGNIKPQGIDTSFLVATLTAAIQEQQTIINDLKARITALEGAA